MGKPGRPKMSDEEKEAARSKRAADKADAKASVSAKADKAEARASTGKAPEKAKLRSPSEGQDLKNVEDLDREEKALFLHHLPIVKRAREALGTANSNLRNALKSAKAEGGFTKADFDTAFALETAEKEAKERGRIARALKIARIVGSSMGNQLDLFLEPDRTPAAENAYAEGERDAMQNKPARSQYDPSTEQARKYLEGYHSVSEKRIKDGIGKLDPAAADAAAKDAKGKVETDLQKAQDAKAFEQPAGEAVGAAGAAPASGVAMTRAQFKAQQEAAKGSGKPN